ncbi:hypothetical protein IAD21_00687 [Abditibacteriota bacterium]|nr:hypothetical protein IAD21_00687 [Abditibacteriota bacterium]
MTLQDLLALPYGGVGASSTLGLSELLTLPYTGSSPFSQGLTSDDFRALVRQYGERVRWLRAVESGAGPNGEVAHASGKVFVEQTLPAEARVFLTRATRTLQNTEFSVLSAGSTQLSFLPDELAPRRDDRFVALDRTFAARHTFTPSGQAFDVLPHKNIVSIDAVFSPGQRLAPNLYSLSGKSIHWAGSHPIGQLTALYTYRPHFEWLGEEVHYAPSGTDNRALPTSGPLRLLSAREE